MAASTTQKLTLGVLALIYRYCVAMNCGVIVRLKGEDVGLTADMMASEGDKVTWPNAPAKFNTLTIPKATIAQMESDFAMMNVGQTAILFADLSPKQQSEIQEMFGVFDMLEAS